MRYAVRWLAAVLLVAGYSLGTVGSAEATATATTVNAASTLSSTALYEPSGLAGAPAGRTVPLTWTAASGGGNGNGYAISGVNIGSNAATPCPGSAASYTTFVGGATGTSFTDSTALAGGTQGTFVCYLAQTGYSPAGGPPWASPPAWISAPVSPATLVVAKTAIGFFANSVAFTNGGTASTLDAGDRIILTFDQAVDPTTIPAMAGVCAKNSNATIYLGQTLGGATCSTSFNVGTLTGMALSSKGSKDGLYNATAAWSNSNKTYTITIGTVVPGSKANTLAAGTETYTPAAAIKSSSGAAAICVSTAPCTPTTSGRP